MRLRSSELLESKVKWYAELLGEDLGKLRRLEGRILLFIPVVVTLSVILSIFSKLFLSLLFLSVFLYFYIPIELWARSSELSSRLTIQIPFFTILAYMNSRIGKGILRSLKETREFRGLRELTREYDLTLRYSKVMRTGTFEALTRREQIHGRDSLGRLLSRYLSSLRRGDESEVLGKIMEESLNGMRESFQQYAERAGDLVEISFTLLLLLPAMLIAFSLLSGPNSIMPYLPLLSLPVLILIAESTQPKVIESKMGWRNLSPLGSLLILFLPLPLFLRVYMVVVAACVLSIPRYQNYTRSLRLNELVPDLLKEVGELQRVGYGLRYAISRLSPEMTKNLNQVMPNFKVKSKLGEVPVAETSSVSFNFTWNLLRVLDMNGDRENEWISELYDVASSINLALRRLSSQLRTFEFLCFLSPILLGFTLGVMSRIGDIENIKATTIIYTSALSLVFSKFSKFTMIHIPLLLSSSTIALIVAQYFLPALAHL